MTARLFRAAVVAGVVMAAIGAAPATAEKGTK